jgi:GNAT superfamily N-acetyltransferase
VAAIIQAIMPEHETTVHDLFAEYLRWVCPRIYEEYKAIFDAELMIVHDMETIDIFLPPHGILLLSFEDGLPSGCACTRTIGEEIAELKRMYVRPHYRGKGIGSRLVQESIKRVREMGYSTMRLDSARFMLDAHRIYRSCGFYEILPYESSEIPRKYWQYWVFMELNLRQVSGKTSY